MMKNVRSLITFNLCSIILTTVAANPSCVIDGNRVNCDSLNVNTNERIEYSEPITRVTLTNLKGSIGRSTLSSFSGAVSLNLDSCQITDLEEGALCSWPDLKELRISCNSIYILTKKHLSGCNNLHYFSSNLPIEEDAMENMNNLKVLELSDQPSLTKAYFTPLQQLTSLTLKIDTLIETEPGLFCVPSLESFKLLATVPLEITESLFEECDNVREIFIKTRNGLVPEGQNPFNYLIHLETLVLLETTVPHLTREFFSGVPNLRKFEIRGNGKQKLMIDSDTFVSVPNISLLILADAGLEDSDLQAINALKNLESLVLADNDLENISVIENLPKLKTINIDGNKIRRMNLMVLQINFPMLEQVYLRDNPLDQDIVQKLSDDDSIKFNKI